MEVSVLASGSSGNCYYIEDSNSAILVDAGLSCKQTLERLSMIKKSPDKIQAIFITHEHVDHIRGADVLARTLNIPIFSTEKTLKSRFLCENQDLLKIIKKSKPITIKNLKIQSFSKSHQAVDPISFSISDKRKTLSIITDLGFPCLNTIEQISKSNFLCLESNHDYNMLLSGHYPIYLKRWISSDTGHLSNKQAALSILEHAPQNLSHIVLSHLSENNNTPELAMQTFQDILSHRKNFNPKIEISSRFSPTPLFKI
jgi:phosphoribosyl 1,2-cyclic phosphodiesterase